MTLGTTSWQIKYSVDEYKLIHTEKNRLNYTFIVGSELPLCPKKDIGVIVDSALKNVSSVSCRDQESQSHVCHCWEGNRKQNRRHRYITVKIHGARTSMEYLRLPFYLFSLVVLNFISKSKFASQVPSVNYSVVTVSCVKVHSENKCCFILTL